MGEITAFYATEKRGKRIWTEDDCTTNHEDHETLPKAWQRLAGAPFSKDAATASEDCGDGDWLLMPNGWMVWYSYPGGSAIWDGKPAEVKPATDPIPMVVAAFRARLVSVGDRRTLLYFPSMIAMGLEQQPSGTLLPIPLPDKTTLSDAVEALARELKRRGL